MQIFIATSCTNEEKHYLCIVFFMVLDLRLMEDWLSGDNLLFYIDISSFSFVIFFFSFFSPHTLSF